MSNIYILTESINGHLMDVSSVPSRYVSEHEFIVYGDKGYEKAEELKKEGISVREIAKQFCGNCGDHIVGGTCRCPCDCLPQGNW